MMVAGAQLSEGDSSDRTALDVMAASDLDLLEHCLGILIRSVDAVGSMRA